MTNRDRRIIQVPETGIHRIAVLLAYIYLALPTIIFLLGWCHPAIGIPLAGLCVWSLCLCVRGREGYIAPGWKPTQANKWKIVVIAALILAWVALSGIGGYAWQNEDHLWRNAIFQLLVDHEWPPVSGSRGLTYYMGTWLPAALAGKLLDVEAGYAALFVWVLLGICILYALICIWRRKIVLWPLMILIFFSGLDMIAASVFTGKEIRIFGSDHLEWWVQMLQYTGNTSQLYWVFNQAVPAWLAVMLLFMDEPPRNMIWVCSLLMLTSSLPFVGILPIMIYYLFQRSEWNEIEGVGHGWRMLLRNMGSFQNLVGGGSVLVITFLYLTGNDVFGGDPATVARGNIAPVRQWGVWFPWLVILIAALALHLSGSFLFWVIKQGKGHLLRNVLHGIAAVAVTIWLFRKLGTERGAGNEICRLAYMVLFLAFEVGIYLYLLFKDIRDKGLFNVVAVSLLVIPFIRIGYSNDFCMRASIPALFILMLWCMEALGKKRINFRIVALLVCLAVGSVSAVHEISRALINSRGEYTIGSVEEDIIFTGTNFSGGLDTFFWKYIAR